MIESCIACIVYIMIKDLKIDPYISTRIQYCNILKGKEHAKENILNLIYMIGFSCFNKIKYEF